MNGIRQQSFAEVNELWRQAPAAEGKLWLCGTLPAPEVARVAVIGSRGALPEQLAMAERLAAALTRAGAVIVSGGALGIDTCALRGALQAGGRPVAVLPGGLDRPYPEKNRELFGEVVAAGGLLLSRLPPGQRMNRGNFMARNRLMTQMVDAVLVVCGEVPSGTLQCASAAWRAGLPVLAVPWTPGKPCSSGSNSLLAAGARALVDEAGCGVLVQRLRRRTGPLLLARDERPPEVRQVGVPSVSGTLALMLPTAGQPGAEPQEETKERREIDAGARGWQSYGHGVVIPDASLRGLPARPLPGKTTRLPLDQGGGQTEEVLGLPGPTEPPTGLQADVLGAVQRAGPAGRTLADLATELAEEPGRLAAAALELQLTGWLKRRPGGIFHT